MTITNDILYCYNDYKIIQDTLNHSNYIVFTINRLLADLFIAKLFAKCSIKTFSHQTFSLYTITDIGVRSRAGGG